MGVWAGVGHALPPSSEKEGNFWGSLGPRVCGCELSPPPPASLPGHAAAVLTRQGQPLSRGPWAPRNKAFLFRPSLALADHPHLPTRLGSGSRPGPAPGSSLPDNLLACNVVPFNKPGNRPQPTGPPVVPRTAAARAGRSPRTFLDPCPSDARLSALPSKICCFSARTGNWPQALPVSGCSLLLGTWLFVYLKKIYMYIYNFFY